MYYLINPTTVLFYALAVLFSAMIVVSIAAIETYRHRSRERKAADLAAYQNLVRSLNSLFSRNEGIYYVSGETRIIHTNAGFERAN
jgi:hypothetical protein